MNPDLDKPDSFSDLIARAKNGDEEAVTQLVEQYGPHIRRVVRRRLPDELRAKFDSIDFVQAAWASILVNRSQLDRFNESRQFIGFISAVVSNKVGMEIRKRMKGQKFNIRRETVISERSNNVVLGEQATPSQVAIANEELLRMLDGRKKDHQEIIKLRLDGDTIKEIAQKVGCDERTVRRLIERLESERRRVD